MLILTQTMTTRRLGLFRFVVTTTDSQAKPEKHPHSLPVVKQYAVRDQERERGSSSAAPSL